MSGDSQVEELTPSIARLRAIGCEVVSLVDHGAFGYVATFQKKKLVFSIVKDRGFWHLTGDSDDLKRSPSRKSRGLVEADAIAWLDKKGPIQPPQRNAGSRSFSSDSPASETPSSLGPRG